MMKWPEIERVEIWDIFIIVTFGYLPKMSQDLKRNNKVQIIKNGRKNLDSLQKTNDNGRMLRKKENSFDAFTLNS